MGVESMESMFGKKRIIFQVGASFFFFGKGLELISSVIEI
jgi:hypothetical protein